MIVAEEDEVHRRQLPGRETRAAHAARADDAERAGVGREHRIGDEHRAGGADEKRRVADEGHGDAAGFDRQRRRFVRGQWDVARPLDLLAGLHPAQHLPERSIGLAVRVEEANAVTVIGDRIPGHADLTYPEPRLRLAPPASRQNL
jgi:hypothetical protein